MSRSSAPPFPPPGRSGASGAVMGPLALVLTLLCIGEPLGGPSYLDQGQVDRENVARKPGDVHGFATILLLSSSIKPA